MMMATAVGVVTAVWRVLVVQEEGLCTAGGCVAAAATVENRMEAP